MKKREVIFYSGFSMEPPETVELLDNLEGRMVSDEKQKIIKLEEYKILSFWDKIEQIGVWKWSKKYPVKEPELKQLLDGYNWQLKLRDRNGKAKYCSGYMSFPRKFKELIKELNILEWGNIINFDVVINATSLGLNNEKINLDFSKVGKNKLFYDVIYNPAETNFLKEGKKLGNITENGATMFIYQASEAFKLWHGIEPEVNFETLKLLKND